MLGKNWTRGLQSGLSTLPSGLAPSTLALLHVFPTGRLMRAVGYEVDPHYGEPAAKLWKDTGLDVRLEDFTQAAPTGDAEKFQPFDL